METVIVIGCGSIGQRHIKNLLSITNNRPQVLAFDINMNKLQEIKELNRSIIASTDINGLWDLNPSIAFITNPTALHTKYALEAVRHGCHLFIEKPLSDNLKNINRLIELIKNKNLITMVGCNMRFYWAVKKIKNLIGRQVIGKIVSARIEAGQYLPDWHPWEDYRQMYSARKELGGGVILDAIHEIDYSMWLLGNVKNVKSIFGKLSNLEIETEDTAEILLKFKNGPIANIHMDYVQRSYSRSCKIIGEEGTIFWDFNRHCIELYTAKTKKIKIIKEPDNYETNQMYTDEIKYFLDRVKRRENTFNGVVDAAETLKVALLAKRGLHE